MDEYLRSLQRQLKSFPPEEQAALMEEIHSHMESGETDPGMGSDSPRRRERLMKEMGSPEDMGQGLKAVHRPNRLMDYLLVAIPYTLSLYFTAFYLQLRPQHPWMDIRLNVIMDLVLVAIALWRRSTLVILFWINIAAMQLLYIVLQGVWQPYWYFGLQTILWGILLVALLVFFGRIVWQNRHDPLIMVYALLPLCTQLLGTAVWSIQPVTYVYNPLDRSLLTVFLRLQEGNAEFYGTLVTMALFFLAANRDARWIALVASALLIGFGRVYLFDYRTGAVAMVAQWVYYLYILIPMGSVGGAWLLDWRKRQQIRLIVQNA